MDNRRCCRKSRQRRFNHRSSSLSGAGAERPARSTTSATERVRVIVSVGEVVSAEWGREVKARESHTNTHTHTHTHKHTHTHTHTHTHSLSLSLAPADAKVAEREAHCACFAVTPAWSVGSTEETSALFNRCCH